MFSSCITWEKIKLSVKVKLSHFFCNSSSLSICASNKSFTYILFALNLENLSFLQKKLQKKHKKGIEKDAFSLATCNWYFFLQKWALFGANLSEANPEYPAMPYRRNILLFSPTLRRSGCRTRCH